MPLHADREAARELDRLDHAVRCGGRDARVPRVGDGLVVAAVHGSLRGAERPRQCGGRLDPQRVTALAEAVRRCVRQVGRQVVVEASAAVQREELHAVADREHRHVAFERRREQRGVERMLARRDRIEDDLGRVAPRGQEIAAARQQQAIEAHRERARIALWRQDHRVGARGVQRGDDGCSELEPAGLAAALAQARRNADERPHRAEYTFTRRAAERPQSTETMAKVLIAGCGYVGSALGAALVADGDVVFGLRRRVVSLPAGVQPIEADLAVAKNLRDLPPRLDFVVYAASPGGSDDALYRTAYVEGVGRLLDALAAQGQNPKRIFLLSSTSVYGQDRGDWVDETSPTQPLDFRGKRILEAEGLLGASGQAATIVRLGGIYGPQRISMIERVRSGRAIVARGGPRYTNRIHRDDCAGALRHLMRLPAPEGVYLGVDCEPADDAAVLRWLAGAIGAPEPRVDAASGGRTRANKRCRNDRLLASGYSFRYPTFREGYSALLTKLR